MNEKIIVAVLVLYALFLLFTKLPIQQIEAQSLAQEKQYLNDERLHRQWEVPSLKYDWGFTEVIEEIDEALTPDTTEENVEMAESEVEEVLEIPADAEIPQFEPEPFAVKYTIDTENYPDLNFIGRIKVPKINIDYPIIDQTTDDLLNISICRFWGGALNQNGNVSLAGHNNKNLTMFGALKTVVPGDEVYIEDANGKNLVYVVQETFYVQPEDNWVAEITQTNEPEVTLITCAPGSDEIRQIFKLFLKRSDEPI